MIERMKKTIVLASASHKAELLSSLRDLGVMHVTDMVTKSSALDELEKRRAEYSSVLQTLKERGDKKAAPASGDFSTVHASVMSLLTEEEELRDSVIALQNERERILPLGEFDPEALRSLSKDGVELRIYTGTKKDETILAASDISYFPLRYEGKGIAVAILADGSLADHVLGGTVAEMCGIQTLQMGVFGGIIVGLGVAGADGGGPYLPVDLLKPLPR